MEPRGPGLGIFPGAIGAQAPALARGVPTPSLDPRRTPASLDKRPSASMALGHQGPGWGQLAYVAANPQTPPSRPHHYEDPPVLPSVKGSPFTDGRTGGRPPGDGFCPGRGWLVSGPDLGLRMRRQAPPPQASLRAWAPPLRYPARFTGSLRSCPGKRKPSLPPRGPRVFPWTTLPSSSPTPAETEVPGKTWGPRAGAGAGAGHGAQPGGFRSGGQNPRPPTGSARGTQAYASP